MIRSRAQRGSDLNGGGQFHPIAAAEGWSCRSRRAVGWARPPTRSPSRRHGP